MPSSPTKRTIVERLRTKGAEVDLLEDMQRGIVERADLHVESSRVHNSPVAFDSGRIRDCRSQNASGNRSARQKNRETLVALRPKITRPRRDPVEQSRRPTKSVPSCWRFDREDEADADAR